MAQCSLTLAPLTKRAVDRIKAERP